MTQGRLGIIQSRGLGDIVIALPIAGHYHDLGWSIHWPILEQFVPHARAMAPWVRWTPVPYDAPGRYFYDVPNRILRQQGCDEILCLYQALTGHDFHTHACFQHTSFDQHKYTVASVPFVKKWDLARYITRTPAREAALIDQLRTDQPHYAVLHLEGSDHRAEFDRSAIPADWQIIEITAEPDRLLTDWIELVDQADSVVCVDSVWANLVDQLALGSDRYFIPRSHMGLTPVLGQDWTWIEKPK
jgi:hypothetical protein